MKLLASWVPFRNRCYVVIDVQGNVRVLSFLLDHVLAFPVNLLKTIAATGAIFSLKFTKNRLGAGLRPDPLGALECSPDHLALRGLTPMKMVLIALICGPDLPLLFKLHRIWSVDSQENH